jgi:hypothetical protein
MNLVFETLCRVPLNFDGSGEQSVSRSHAVIAAMVEREEINSTSSSVVAIALA